MKPPEEYVLQAGGRQRPNVVTRAAATAAVAQALADAERYRQLLMASLRRLPADRPITDTLCSFCLVRFVKHPDEVDTTGPNDPPF